MISASLIMRFFGSIISERRWWKMDRYRNYNENPRGKRVGDCTVRAISTLLDRDWESTYIDLAVMGFIMCDMPSANHVWGAYLRERGYRRDVIPNECPDCYTVREFCEDRPHGRYMLALSGHVIAVVDGQYYDTWDSGDEIPTYYWYKEE